MFKTLITTIFLISFLSVINAQPGGGKLNSSLTFGGDVSTSLKWNTQNGLVYKQTNEGTYGSTLFTDVGINNIAFLNEINNEVTVYENNNIMFKFSSAISPSLGINFVNDKYYIFGINECSIHGKDGGLIKKINLPKSIKSIRRVVNISDDVFFVCNNQSSYLYKNGIFEEENGIALNKNIFVKSIKKDSNHVVIEKRKLDGSLYSYDFFTPKNLSSLKVVGQIDDNLIFDVEYIKKEKPLITERYLVAAKHREDGLIVIDELLLPNSYFISVRNDLLVDNNTIYYYLTTPDRGKVYKINLKHHSSHSIFKNISSETICHYNNYFEPISNIDLSKNITKDSVVDPISRESIIAKAEEYENYLWTATNDNIWDGDICDNQKVISAPYVKVGENIGVPYMWDGFSSLDKFNEGMENGLSAGNINTKPSIGSMNCAEGVDCSGFISQVWGTTWKYDTREFYPIVIEYDSWSKLKPGDIANKPGHVRLFHSWNDDGTMNMLEATSRDNVWRVVYNTYTISEMQSKYTPCYLYSVYDETASVTVNKLIGAVKIFPNPANASINIEVDSRLSHSNINYEIINSRGEILKRGNNVNASINIENLSTGIYFVKIKYRNSTLVKKLFKK